MAIPVKDDRAEWRKCRKCGEMFFHHFFFVCSDCRGHVPDSRANHMPTEAEIVEETAKLRERWTEEEYYERAGREPSPVEVSRFSEMRAGRRGSFIGYKPREE